MLVLVRRQRHYIAADCDALRSFVLTSGDCLVTTINSQLTEARDQFESAQVNVDKNGLRQKNWLDHLQEQTTTRMDLRTCT
jgi:hypothetical protein